MFSSSISKVMFYCLIAGLLACSGGSESGSDGGSGSGSGGGSGSGSGGGAGAGGNSGDIELPKRISWVAPTTYTDGTNLTDLAKFRVYYGATANSLQPVPELDVEDSAATSLDFVDLTSEDIDLLKGLIEQNSTHWFAMTAINSSGTESVLSDAVQYIPAN